MDTIPSALSDPERLAEFMKIPLLDTAPEPSFDRLTSLAAHLLDAPVSLVSLVDDHRQFLKSNFGLVPKDPNSQETPLSHSFCKHVVILAEPLIISDARLNPLVQNNPAIAESNVIAYAGIPLTTQQGHILGSFCAIDHKPREWTEDEINILQALAASVMTEIELRRNIIDLEETQQVLEHKEHQLQLALDKQVEVNELKNRFGSMVSHEFRNPLAVIASSAGLLETYYDRLSPARRAEHFEKIQEQVKVLTGLLDDVLALSRAEAVTTEITTQQVDFQQFCAGILTEMQEISTHHTIVYTATGTPCDVWVDVKLLRQAISNLLSNAVKYSPDGGRIEFTVHFESSQVVICISDQGRGIPPADLPQLFEPFYRASNVGRIAGTGLGLAIVKRGVEAHGGTITVESTVGVGTAFTMVIPCVTPLQPDAEAVPHPTFLSK
ncbi:MAG: HAMP domain-containing sensor histidine kinase [bacterium]|nr:HAMP domain-containing sensor histidine kinase [bacterium]